MVSQSILIGIILVGRLGVLRLAWSRRGVLLVAAIVNASTERWAASTWIRLHLDTGISMIIILLLSLLLLLVLLLSLSLSLLLLLLLVLLFVCLVLLLCLLGDGDIVIIIIVTNIMFTTTYYKC